MATGGALPLRGLKINLQYVLHIYFSRKFQFWRIILVKIPQNGVKKHKNLAKLVKIQNPVNPGFEAQKTNPDFRGKPGFQTRVG